jgi:bifunctional DNA-binding transcriptional regulator/antitoxin component of YhaV-PrlF toxin-antitoxin module
MKAIVELDASNRIVLSRELRRATGIPRRQKVIVSATPGRIVLEMEANASGQIVLEEAVDQSRHYSR